MNDFAARSGFESTESLVSCADYENISWADSSACSYDEDVAVFRFHWPDYTGNEPDWPSLLRPDELKRADRYRRQEDRYRSLYTRSVLRVLVGTYTNQHPAAIRFATGVTHKPILPDSADWHINATHSGNWILLAIGRISVGVDVEKIDPKFSFRNVLPYSFDAQEQQYIETGDAALRRFYQLWTRKEALVKATAKGMDQDFCQIPSLTGLHRVAASLIGAAGAWTVGSFTVAEEYAGAIAYQAMAGMPRFYTIDGSLGKNFFATNGK